MGQSATRVRYVPKDYRKDEVVKLTGDKNIWKGKIGAIVRKDESRRKNQHFWFVRVGRNTFSIQARYLERVGE